MTIKTLLATAAATAALTLPGAASAQLTSDVEASVTATTPTEPVDQVDALADTAADPVNDATDAVDAEADVAAGADAEAGPLVAATSADVTAGATVRDTEGGVVGEIESVNASGAVVATGKSRVQIPVSSFGKNEQGLVLAMSKAELDAAAAAATPS